jgi:hypothetical protein
MLRRSKHRHNERDRFAAQLRTRLILFEPDTPASDHSALINVNDEGNDLPRKVSRANPPAIFPFVRLNVGGGTTSNVHPHSGSMLEQDSTIEISAATDTITSLDAGV